MKIDCGPTPAEKEEALRQWHRWFAWRPVRLGSHDCRWLEWLERRRQPIGYGGYSCYLFEYRILEAKR